MGWYIRLHFGPLRYYGRLSPAHRHCPGRRGPQFTRAQVRYNNDLSNRVYRAAHERAFPVHAYGSHHWVSQHGKADRCTTDHLAEAARMGRP